MGRRSLARACWMPVVVGGGITGLVAARRLRQAGCSVRALNAGARPCGVIQTRRRDGCQFECGPNSDLDTKPLIGQMVAPLGLQSRWRLAAATATLLRPHAPAAAAALDTLPSAQLATVASAYRRADIAHPLDGFGCLVPRKEGRRLLGVPFSDSMDAGRAPRGSVLLTSFVGGLRQPALAGT
jgi:protoporphyrinogen oxidase